MVPTCSIPPTSLTSHSPCPCRMGLYVSTSSRDSSPAYKEFPDGHSLVLGILSASLSISFPRNLGLLQSQGNILQLFYFL